MIGEDPFINSSESLKSFLTRGNSEVHHTTRHDNDAGKSIWIRQYLHRGMLCHQAPVATTILSVRQP